jgi:hypothetical protein
MASPAAEIIIVGVGATGSVGASVGFVIHSLRRRNRVSPTVRTRAPLNWLWSWRLSARLHRHLARTTAAARACIVDSREQLGLTTMVQELEAHACAIDAQLVAVDRSPQPTRNRLLRELYAEVRQVDAVAERIIRMGRAWAGAEPSVRGLAGVSERLDALEAAMADLARLDRTATPPSAGPPSAGPQAAGPPAAASPDAGRVAAGPSAVSGELRDGYQPVERSRRPPVVDRRDRRFER